MYFMSTACGRPQGVEGVRPMWTKGRGVINLILFVDVINGWPLIPSNFPRSYSISPYSSSSPYFQMFLCSYTLNFLPPTEMLHFLPPKLTKPFVYPLNDKFPHKMRMMKISASFPPWDGHPGLYKSRVIYA